MGERCSPAGSKGGALGLASRGFTLLEMIIVLVILGLVMGLALTRGPMRGPMLEATAAAREIAQTLRLARSSAIANNRTVTVVVDVAQRSFRVDAAPPRVLPAGVTVSVTAVAGETRGANLGAISFEPDGSSSGGRIELVTGTHHLQVGVDWLTGRVSLADAH